MDHLFLQIERDFKLLYPQAENNFIDFWGEVAEKILILAKAKYEKEEKFRTHSSQALISETDLHVKGMKWFDAFIDVILTGRLLKNESPGIY